MSDAYTLSFIEERGLFAAVLASTAHTVTTQFYATKEDALSAAFYAVSEVL